MERKNKVLLDISVAVLRIETGWQNGTNNYHFAAKFLFLDAKFLFLTFFRKTVRGQKVVVGR